MKVIGPADDFWRVRLSRVDTAEAPDLDWREDILYREPPIASGTELREWNVEAVRLEDDDVALIGSFGDEGEARALLEEAETDLSVLTRSAFEHKYLESELAGSSGDVRTEASAEGSEGR